MTAGAHACYLLAALAAIAVTASPAAQDPGCQMAALVLTVVAMAFGALAHSLQHRELAQAPCFCDPARLHRAYWAATTALVGLVVNVGVASFGLQEVSAKHEYAARLCVVLSVAMPTLTELLAETIHKLRHPT